MGRAYINVGDRSIQVLNRGAVLRSYGIGGDIGRKF